MQKRQPQKDTHGEKIKEGEIIIKQEKQDADMVNRQRQRSSVPTADGILESAGEREREKRIDKRR
jgi:hypothetical protein